MRTTSLCALAVAGASIASAIELAPRSPNPRVIGVDLQRNPVSDIITRDRARLERLHKRQNGKTVEQVLDNEDSLYFCNITLGTPPQNLRVHIDTGSSDLWVNVANSTFCSSRFDPCVGGTFDPRASSSYKYVNSDFNISYVDGSGATGDYITDTIGIGGLSLENFQFAVGQTSESQQGVFGIGYTINEVQVNNAGDPTYPNLPQALKDGGYVNRNAYSLWLNDLDASTGTILFGGVNSAKYQGDLHTVPVYAVRGEYVHFLIAMSSFGYNGSSVESSNLPAPVILDSGSTLCRIPDDVTAAIYNELDVLYDPQQEVGYAPCSLRNSNSYFEFGFSGANIQVPFNEMFIDMPDENGNPSTFDDGTEACLFGIAPARGLYPYILGDTFLRSAYVVYDLELNEVSLAQTVFNATNNDVVEIASGTAAIPGATPAPSTIRQLAAGTATQSARIGAVTGSLTAMNVMPTGGSGSGTSGGSSNSGSSSNGAYATKAPYMVGAAMLAGAGLLL